MRLPPTVRRVQCVSACMCRIFMTVQSYVPVRSLGNSDLRMKKNIVPVGRRSHTPWARPTSSLANEVFHLSLYVPLTRCLYYLVIPVLEFMTNFSTWGITGFRIGSSIVEATKLADACFMCFRVL